MKYTFPLILLLTISQYINSENSIRYGLSFNGYNVEKEERTGLNLSSEGPFSVQDGFILEFDVSFRFVRFSFGYAVRIFTENNEHIDLLLNRTKNSSVIEPQLSVIYKSGQILYSKKLEDIEMEFNEWAHVKLIVDRKKNLFKIIVNGFEFEKEDEYFKEFKKVNIVLGKNNSIKFQTSDVASMSIKNIAIKNLNGKNRYFWKLDKYTDSGAHDIEKGRFASVENPVWLLDEHTFWKNIRNITTEPYPKICFNAEENNIAITDFNTFYNYNIESNTLNEEATKKGIPSGSRANQLMYNPIDKQFFTYNFQDEVAVYDELYKSWSNDKMDNVFPQYWHHNRYFSKKDSSLYTFSGYGFHTYKNDIYKYHFPSKMWSKLSYGGETKITPRYLGGLGVIDDNNLLLFGGYGNESGNQEFSPHNYYDLYIYNIEKSHAEKIWEIDPQTNNFVIANSIVVDTLNSCFYALCFPHQKFQTNLKLYKFSMKEPVYEILADSIPYNFNDTYSYADLYLTSDKKQLVALTSYTNTSSGEANISIYTLAYPPIDNAGLFQKTTSRNPTLYFIALLIAALALFIVYYKKRKVIHIKDNEKVSMPECTTDQHENKSEPLINIITSKKEKKSILLFGGFQVSDMNGQLITGDFSPLLKQLFLLILLNTSKNEKGISSVKLQETLWSNKTKESAKNNRGVTLNKLKPIFEKIGNISINGKNSYWTVTFENDIYCDYAQALFLMNQLTIKPDYAQLEELVSIVSAGELLPNLQTEWVDSFKADFSNRLIDLLLNIISKQLIDLSPAFKINIADVILIHDFLNEEAIKIKCTILVQMGKNGLAQKAYNSFIKEYQTLFGTDYKFTFEQLLAGI